MKILFVFLLFLGTDQFAPVQSDLSDKIRKPGLVAQKDDQQRAVVSEDEKIVLLLTYLRNLNDVVFVRNGSEFSSGKAADHLESKWKKHKKKVSTATDFIDKLATHSKTNEPYMIRYKDGHSISCAELLHKELSRMESTGTAVKESK